MPVSRVDWESISEKDFNETVELLLLRKYQDEPGVYARAIEGRGGDSGIDVDVRSRSTDQLVRIYQLKYFRGGFSGDRAKTRKAQIKKSFEDAMVHEPPAWVLVIPGKGSIAERKFVTLLRGNRKIRVGFFGSTELNNLLAKYPDIHDWALRDQSLELLREFHRESAALTKPDDLANEVLRLGKRADARDSHWGVNFTRQGDTVVQEIYAKHPNAVEDSPIQISLSATIARGEDANKALERTLGYGLGEPLILSGDEIKSFNLTGPPFLDFDGAPTEIRVQPQTRTPATGPFRETAIDKDGRALASIVGQVTSSGAGGLGGHIIVSFPGGLTQEMLLANGKTKQELSWNLSPEGQTARSLKRVISFIDCLPHAATLEFEFKGIKEIAQLPTASSPFENDSYFRELIDDLAFIERSADVDFSLPAEAPDPFDRVWIRVARMLLEGRVTAAPGVEELTGTLGHDIDVSSMEATLTQPGAIVLTQYEFAIETLGQRILIGDVAIYHPNAIVLDGEKLFRDAVEGKADLPIAYVPNDATPFRIYSPSRVDNSSKVDPWGIAGISEHQGFAHIPESVAAVARNPPLTGE